MIKYAIVFHCLEYRIPYNSRLSEIADFFPFRTGRITGTVYLTNPKQKLGITVLGQGEIKLSHHWRVFVYTLGGSNLQVLIMKS